MRHAAQVVCLVVAAACAHTAWAAQPAAPRAAIPGGTFATILPPAEKLKEATVRAFQMDRRTEQRGLRAIRGRPARVAA